MTPKNADDAVVMLRSAIAGLGSRELFDAFELLLAERDKLFTNGLELFAQIARLQEELRNLRGYIVTGKTPQGSLARAFREGYEKAIREADGSAVPIAESAGPRNPYDGSAL